MEILKKEWSNSKGGKEYTDITAEFKEDGSLHISGTDMGEKVEKILGDYDYEYWMLKEALTQYSPTHIISLMNTQDIRDFIFVRVLFVDCALVVRRMFVFERIAFKNGLFGRELY